MSDSDCDTVIIAQSDSDEDIRSIKSTIDFQELKDRIDHLEEVLSEQKRHIEDLKAFKTKENQQKQTGKILTALKTQIAGKVKNSVIEAKQAEIDAASYIEKLMAKEPVKKQIDI